MFSLCCLISDLGRMARSSFGSYEVVFELKDSLSLREEFSLMALICFFVGLDLVILF